MKMSAPPGMRGVTLKMDGYPPAFGFMAEDADPHDAAAAVKAAARSPLLMVSDAAMAYPGMAARLGPAAFYPICHPMSDGRGARMSGFVVMQGLRGQVLKGAAA